MISNIGQHFKNRVLVHLRQKMDRGLVVKQESEMKEKRDNLSQVKRDVLLFEKTTLKSVPTIVKNTLPSQQSEQTFLIAISSHLINCCL